MDAAAIAERITRLEGEIDELSKEIREEKKKRDATADDTEKAIILDSAIKVLYSDRSVLIADRSRLLAAAVPTPGKNPPLTADASVPPLHANTPTPRSLPRPLVRRHDSSLVSNLVSNLVPNSRLRVRTRLVRPSCEEG